MLRPGRPVLLIVCLAALALCAPAQAATRSVSSTSQLQTAVQQAATGDVVEVAGGSYGSVTLSTARTGYVTVRPADGATVTFSGFGFGGSASFIRVENVVVTAQVAVAAGSAHDLQLVGSDVRGVAARAGNSNILFEHNDIHDCGNCFEAASVDPSVHGSPCPTCTAQAPISNVTFRGNRVVDPGTDAIYVGNFRNLTVEDNEIIGVQENGDHSDCLQSTFGGSGLVYRGNYVHDNRCQGFFIKDGRVSNVTVEDNLFAHNTKPCGAGVTCDPGSPYTFQVYDTIGLTMRNNTFASNAGGETFRERDNTNLAVDHNVFYGFGPFDDQGPDYGDYYHQGAVLSEDYDIGSFASSWPSSYRGAHDLPTASPAFRDPGNGDYRLSAPVTGGGVTYTPGVDWAVADRAFGRAADGISTPPASSDPVVTSPPADPTPATLPITTAPAPAPAPVVSTPQPPEPAGPTVTLTAPAANATVTKTIRFAATATSGAKIRRVEFWVAGTRVATDTRSPYTTQVRVGSLSSGTHTVTARAFDAAGRAASAAVTVRVTRSGGRVRAAAIGAQRGGAAVASVPSGDAGTRITGEGPRRRTVDVALTRCSDRRGAVAATARVRTDGDGRLDVTRREPGLCLLSLS